MENIFVLKFNVATDTQCLAVVEHLESCDTCHKLATVNAAWVLKTDGFDFKEAIATALKFAADYPKGVPDAFATDDGGVICEDCWHKQDDAASPDL